MTVTAVLLNDNTAHLATDIDKRNDTNELMLEFLDGLVGERQVWEGILRNNTMNKPWLVPYYVGDSLGQVVQQQLFGPRNATCVCQSIDDASVHACCDDSYA